MDTFEPTQVYKNLLKLLTYRNVQLTTAALTDDTLAQRLNHYEFVKISGTRAAADIRGAAEITILLIAPHSTFSNKTADFKKLLKEVPKGDKNIELIIVSHSALTVHVKKQIDIYRADRTNVTIEDYDYKIFLLENPAHACVPKHSIPSEAEVEEFCTTHYKDRISFPKILQSDPQAVWLGLKPGMIVKVERLSETAGYACAYRVCIKG